MEPRELLRSQLQSLGVQVAGQAVADLLWFLEELLRWNRRVNLTAVTDPTAGVEKHLVDSLTLLPLLSGRERLLDIGSGGGFPCLPLKIAAPALEVLSVEATAKKVAFQNHVARSLGLEGFQAVHRRAEDLPSSALCRPGFDVIVSRAFAALPIFAALALPCLAQDGRIIAMKGSEGAQELARTQEELEGMGLVCRERRDLSLPVSGAGRTLIVLSRE